MPTTVEAQGGPSEEDVVLSFTEDGGLQLVNEAIRVNEIGQRVHLQFDYTQAGQLSDRDVQLFVRNGEKISWDSESHYLESIVRERPRFIL